MKNRTAPFKTNPPAGVKHAKQHKDKHKVSHAKLCDTCGQELHDEAYADMNMCGTCLFGEAELAGGFNE